MAQENTFTKEIRLRLEMCSTCMKMCRDNCPTGIASASESYTPYIRSLHVNLNTKGIRPYDEGALDSIFSCLTCNLCNTFCLPKVDEEDLMKLARAAIVQSGIDVSKYSGIANSIDTYHNPLREPHSTRINSFKHLLKNKDKTDTVLFLGCMSSYREIEIACATIELLQKLKVKFSLMDDEWCCGSPSNSTGFTETTLNTMVHNIAEWKNHGIKTIITPCSACFRTIKTIYPKHVPEFDFTVHHIIEVIEANLSKVTLNPLNEIIVYHDPCHLGRGMETYDKPRQLMKKIPEITINEMRHSREAGFCCGAGGGVRNNFPELSKMVLRIRTDEFKETGAKYLVSACPLCKFQFKTVLNSSKFKVIDIIELINQQI
ncbi:MAG: (Fe-S)-binding protein [Promethearchaeota archaeon]|nr:MAG: (Fe-S)-binding protein [Candidatus Lokiarchaeota archaeon]